MDALRRKLAAFYTPDQFEPTPINPNLQMKMHANSRVNSATPGFENETPGLENESLPTKLTTRSIMRSESSESLDAQKIFLSENKGHKPRAKVDELSQQLSNMSFSVGDMTQEDGNLSALFDESMRVKDNGNSKLKSSQHNNKSLNMSMGLNDMSLSSFAGESQFVGDSNLGSFFCDSNVENMMSTTSISRVFDEIGDKK